MLLQSDGPVRNVVVGIVCGVLLLIHLLVGLIAHKLDHLENLRLSCIPLCGQAGRYHYRVLIKTGWQRGAGTSAHVGISLYGLNKSGSRHLRKEGAFQRNGLDDFQVETDANLGEIWKICIWHDNTGLDPSWYLQHVVVWDMQMDNMFFFVVEDWLSVENEKNSGMVQKVVLATCPQELQKFGRMLRAQLLFGLREHHLWLSLWERPAHSSFSRAQRVTSCALLLHLYLAAGAVWYGAVVMELSLPPSPVSDTVEMDVYLSHRDFSCSSFLSMPRGPESSTYERPSPFTGSLGSLKLQSEVLGPSNMGNGSQDRSCSEWSELSEHKPMYEGGLYKSPSSVSVCSVASTFLPSLPPDSCSIVSNTRIGVARCEPAAMLPSWVLAVVYLLVAVLLGTCLSIVGLYGSKFSSSVVLMWLTSVLSAFLTSALFLEPLKICVRALYLAAVVKPVDPEVEDRLAQETAVRRMVEEQGTKVRPPCGYGLLQAKEEARKVRMVQALMRNCLVYMMFLLVVLMVNYQDNIQEMNSRLLHSSVKRSISSASSGQPNLTALSGTQAVLVEFTQYHRETGLFLPVSILLENTRAHRILSTISIQSFHIPGSHSGLDFTIALTALLLLFSVCILSTELWAMLREGVQYLRQGWHLLQLLLALLSLATASLRLCFLSKANSCLSSHLSQPDAFTDFHSAALLAKRSSQLSAVLLTLLVLQMVGALRFVRRWVVFGAVLQQACSEMCGVFLLFILLLLLFSHTGCVLFSGSVEGFRTIWQTNQSLLGLLRGRRMLHELCERHPVLGPLYCLSTFGVGFWLLGRLCGAMLVHTYRTFQAEMYRPSMEPQDYEMVEFLIKRLKLWMGLSKAKEFRHRVKFEGMESPPSRSSRCSQFSSLSVANSPISPSISSSPAGPRLISSASSLASECSTLSDSPDLQQYVDRLLPSVDSLIAGFDRVNQLTDDVLNIELQLQKASCRIAEKRKKHKDPQPRPQNLKSEVSQLDESPQHMELKPPLSSQQGIPRILPRRRGTHSESSITGPVTHVNAHPGNQSWQQGQTGAELEIRNLPRLRAWNSGSCHSADPIQRSPKTQNPAAIPVRPRSEEGDRSERSKGVPIKRRAWHPEDSEM
ncbi:hypothetical protein MHYP_G00166080 [Metynnis hypsauchen]